jgi:hypothetical protein
MHTKVPTTNFFLTSGARYRGVPQNVKVLSDTYFAKPKSINYGHEEAMERYMRLLEKESSWTDFGLPCTRLTTGYPSALSRTFSAKARK